jgi:coenzyme F420-reducing hydrogenase beta subunit
LCEDVCSFNENYDKSLNLPQPDAYGARHKNMQELEASSSGAAFIAISDWFLNNNGVVYGVGYGEHLKVVHKRATTRAGRDEFRGSKYVQSDLDGIFRQVKSDLESGRIVLFSGTPCQTAGLNSFVGKKLRENLYLIDLICHGVPGPHLWKDYLTYIERKNKSKISNANFRNKQAFGWSSQGLTFNFIDGRKCSCMEFSYFFLQNVMLRQSCYKCHFSNTVRSGDITIGDFWNLNKVKPSFYKERKGVSLVLCNTEKGRKLIECIKDNMEIFPVELKNALQQSLSHPAVSHPKHDSFEKDYLRYGIGYVVRKYVLVLKTQKFIEGARSAMLYVIKKDGKHSFLERVGEIISIIEKKI